jgi:adapter protein MecA 1/2
MRLERLTYNKIKIFLTFDDLSERGITKEDLWQDLPRVHQLFRDMINEADDELGFKADGPIAVEVFSLPAQGMVIIVTKDSTEDDEEFDDEYIEMQVTLDESDDVFYEFRSFEHVISLASRLSIMGITGGKLYSYSDRFYLLLEEVDFAPNDLDTIIAVLAEFGSSSTITTYRVYEYGKELMKEDAVLQINKYFN